MELKCKRLAIPLLQIVEEISSLVCNKNFARASAVGLKLRKKWMRYAEVVESRVQARMPYSNLVQVSLATTGDVPSLVREVE